MKSGKELWIKKIWNINQRVITYEIVDLITNFVTLILSVTILFTLDLPMTLVLLSIVPITL